MGFREVVLLDMFDRYANCNRNFTGSVDINTPHRPQRWDDSDTSNEKISPTFPISS
jgi:hypothetical protein